MSTVYSIVMTIAFFGVLPLILGQVWKGVIYDDNLIFTYLSGFFTILAVFQIFGVPMVFGFVPFHIQMIVFSAIFLVFSIAILYHCLKNKAAINQKQRYFSSYSLYEWIYLIIFIALAVYTVYYALFYDMGTWRSDDGFYASVSSAAIHDDGFFLTEAVSGNYLHKVDAKYGLCGIYVFYAYVSALTRLGVPIIQQTLCASVFLIMAYGAFYLMARLVFNGEKERDNRLIFMILLLVLFLFGMHSRFSLTFRLLGPIWQGKAFLAVVITPYLLAVYPKLLSPSFTIKTMLLLVMLSLASISLTMGGVLVMGAIPGLLTGIYVLGERNLKPVLLLPAAWILPVVNMLLYIVQKF